MTENDEIKALLEKSVRRLRSAKDEFNKENYDFAVSHAYYSMFYCAEALLLTKNLRFSKHSGVHSAFGEYFAKSKEIQPELHRMLLDAFDARSNCDYKYMIDLTREEAEKVLQDAEYFVNEIEKKILSYNKNKFSLKT